MKSIKYILGLDIGSVASKALILDEEKRIVGQRRIYTLPSADSAGKIMEEILEQKDLSRRSIGYVVATGYGRVNVPFADKVLTEITCHAAGVHHLCPSVRTIIDIGGQDSKVIGIDERGRVLRFLMNDKCAAGSGRFLEVMAKALKIPLRKWGEYGKRAQEPATISSMCTVFAESEVISKVAAGVPVSEIISGICQAISLRISGLAANVGTEPEVALTGGVAQNACVLGWMEKSLKLSLRRPDLPQFTGALGAALIGLESLKKGKTG